MKQQTNMPVDGSADPKPLDTTAWDSIVDRAAAAERRGFLALAGGLGLSIIGGGCILYRVMVPGPAPLVAEMCSGEVLAVRSLDARPDRPRVEEIAQDLNAWVRGAREISPDLDYLNRATWRSYYLTLAASQAEKDLRTYHRTHNPVEAARTKTVKLERQTAIPEGGKGDSNTWRLEWHEITKGRDGTVLSAVDYRASVSFVIQPPGNDRQAVERNPRGIFVQTFHWEPVNPAIAQLAAREPR